MPGIAVEIEQIGVGKFQIQTIFVRDHIVLADADIGRRDELDFRFDDLIAGISGPSE